MTYEINAKSDPVTQKIVDEEIENLSLFVESELDDEEIENQSEKVSFLQNTLEVRNQVLSCRGCALRKLSRSSPVALQGKNFKPIIIALGEAPGENEAKIGIGFCGKSGVLLRASAEKVGVRIDDYVNVVACRPPGNRTPTAPEIRACSSNLESQIKALNPFIVLCFGGTALTVAANNKDLRITKDHGVFFKTIWSQPDNTPMWGFGMLHPSYILRAITTINTGNEFDPNQKIEIERAKLSIRKWGENWEYIGQVFQLRELFNADFVSTYGEDLRYKVSTWTNDCMSGIMLNEARKEPKQIYLNKEEGSRFTPSGWGDEEYRSQMEIDVEDIPF